MECEVFKTKEEEFKASLICWDEKTDNRPFVRIKEDKTKDKLDYKLKEIRIIEEKMAISKITGDSIDNINLFDPSGNCYSDRRNVRDFKNS